MSELPEGLLCKDLSLQEPHQQLSLLLMQMLFALSAALATFFLVPRGVSTGEIDIQSDKMSWNTTKKWVGLLAEPHQGHVTMGLPAAHLHLLRVTADDDRAAWRSTLSRVSSD